MVRHEAAEALGGIVGKLTFIMYSAPLDSTSEPVDDNVLSILKEWSMRSDVPRIYENSNEFQYANGLDTTTAEITVGA
ncbi:hypothetical protein Clacol_010003 [Clathrus columnatus]|uniref:Uncharacterized protein n=1 Tax=Clathrus columnatus TaxID=1419009 RepID=A0AAV5ASM1_9AGAM|nr:hypothetical protein Clacol_010003 [Clathrus columnatus]